jgi:hypothetical protein
MFPTDRIMSLDFGVCLLRRGCQRSRSRREMRGPILLTLGWLSAAVGLYLSLVALELRWNLYDWRPSIDPGALGLVAVILMIEWGMGLLARFQGDLWCRGVSLFTCLILFALAVYLLPTEPLTKGLFARTATSPIWYRAARFATLALPLLFWTRAIFRWSNPHRGEVPAR